jgi:RimJ/RimL family protein N-acetyltransferase
MPGPVFLRGEDIDLHRVAREDIDFVHRGRNHPENRQWAPRVHPQTRGDIEDDFEEYMGDAEDGINLLACPDPDTPAGFLSLFMVSHPSGRASLAAWFAPEFHGMGYGTEAAELLVEYAFRERRFHKLTAWALATNTPSRRVMEKVGFQQAGRWRENYYVNGEYVDCVMYGLLREEWATSG